MIIGVTGGVGAGKSLVLSYLREAYGAEIIECDAVGKEVMEPDGCCFEDIVKLFGEEIVLPDGRLDRAGIAAVVFADPAMLDQLNAIVHPAVRRICNERIRASIEAGEPYQVIESAILLDAGYRAVCDTVWYIYAPEEVRAERLRETRGYSDERIRDVMDSQRSEASFREACDAVIDNSTSPEEMHRQIDDLLLGPAANPDF